MRRQSRTLMALALALALPAAGRADDRPNLELSLDEAVKRALENNVDIAVQKYGPESSEQGVFQSRGVFDPMLTSTISQNSRTSPASNAFAGGDKVKTDTVTYNFGVSQYVPSGGNLSVAFNNNRQNTDSSFSTFNPAYSASLSASLSQPLLRNFRVDGARQGIKIAKKNKEISDVQFRQTVINTLSSVKQAYYDLVYAIDNLGAARKNLTLAEKFLDENQIKVKVGTLAPLDVVAAESEKASREEGVIVAEAAVADAEDVIKRAIFPKNDPETWAVRITPTDHPSAEEVRVDTETAIKSALEKRTDVAAARKSVESAGISLDYSKNQTLPQLDAYVSYGATGLGGNLLERQGFGGPVIKTTPGGYGDALSDVFGRDFPTWTIGVNASYAIRNRQASAASAIARINRDQAEASLRRLELQVAQEVRSAARAVESNFKRVLSTRAARVLQDRRLDAEEKKFAAGMSTNFLVTQAQRDLAVAEVAELRAIADYRKSLVNFDRVQEAGLGGGGNLATINTAVGAVSRANAAQGGSQ